MTMVWRRDACRVSNYYLFELAAEVGLSERLNDGQKDYEVRVYHSTLLFNHCHIESEVMC